jgi:hypothetical protein
MPQTKQKPKQKHLKKAVPVAGVVGMSMAMTGGAAATGAVGPTPMHSCWIPHRNSLSMKRKCLTSAWGRSLFSTKKLISPASNMPNGAAEAAEAAEAVEAEAAEVAEAAEGAEAAA